MSNPQGVEDTAGIVIGPGGMWMLQDRVGDEGPDGKRELEVTDVWRYPEAAVLARAENWPGEGRSGATGKGLVGWNRAWFSRAVETMDKATGALIGSMAAVIVALTPSSAGVDREMRRKAELIWDRQIDEEGVRRDG